MALARAGWDRLLERILMGLCHDVNGRVASLEAVDHLVGMGEPLSAGLGDDVARLRGVARRLEDLVGDVDGPSAPLALDALLARALEIHASLDQAEVDAPTVEVAPGLPALLANEARLLRLLLLLAQEAGVHAGTAPTALSLDGDADGVSLSFAVADDAETAERASLLDGVARVDGGTVRVEGGRCVLRLPSLRQARAAGG